MITGNKHFNELIVNVQYFSIHEWTFHRDNVRKMMVMWGRWSTVRLKLNWDVDWERYITIYMAGIDKFILKEKFKSIDVIVSVCTRIYSDWKKYLHYRWLIDLNIVKIKNLKNVLVFHSIVRISSFSESSKKTKWKLCAQLHLWGCKN